QLRLNGGARQQDTREKEALAGEQCHARGQEGRHQQRELLQVKTVENGIAGYRGQKREHRRACIQAQPQGTRPQENAGNGDDEQDNAEEKAHSWKGEAQRRREQKNHVQGIGKAFLVRGLPTVGGIQRPAVEAALDVTGHLWAVRVAAMQQKFAGSQPARVEVRPVAGSGIGQAEILLAHRQEQAVVIVGHAQAEQKRDREQHGLGAKNLHLFNSATLAQHTAPRARGSSHILSEVVSGPAPSLTDTAGSGPDSSYNPESVASASPSQQTANQPEPSVGRHSWREWRFLLFLGLVLVPCFWQERIQAGDLSSHLYNSWLALQINSGTVHGLFIARQSSNIAFDWLLTWLLAAFGAGAAQRIAVSLCILVFSGGTFAFISAASDRRPWFLTPCIAVLAYGFVLHIGFFNFYLSL